MNIEALLLLSILGSSWSEKAELVGLSFPLGFKFGAATASYQIEGAWNVSDKSVSIWDTYTHTPGKVADGTNGDIACDSFNLWQTDIALAKNLGLDFYRFSISWPRILPNGFANKIGEDGKNYYNKLIDGLLAQGIEPMITIFHWDLPQRLQNLGGWANPLIVDWFADYARVVFKLFGDRVNSWLTINEPLSICALGYGGNWAPGLTDPEVAHYICIKNVMLAHGKAYRVYEEEFRKAKNYTGKLSMANGFWFEGKSKSKEDVDLAELVREYSIGIYSHPIFSKEGGWPPSIEKYIAENSKKQGYPRSRLPAFTKEEIEIIRGSYDFYGLNHYTSRIVHKKYPDEIQKDWPFFGAPELDVNFDHHPMMAPSEWFWVSQKGVPKIRDKLNWIKNHYGKNIEIVICENGFSSSYDDIEDDHRVQYFKDYLRQVLLAVKVDKVNVTAYTAWTLIDNFDWQDGYVSRFGLHKVDFNDPKRTRTPRKSAKYYKAVIEKHSLDLGDKKAEFPDVPN